MNPLLGMLILILALSAVALDRDHNKRLARYAELLSRYQILEESYKELAEIELTVDQLIIQGKEDIIWNCINNGWAWIANDKTQTGLYMLCDQIVVDKVTNEQYTATVTALKGQENNDQR